MQILIGWYFPGKSESILVNVVVMSLPQRGHLIWLVAAKRFFLFIIGTRLIIPCKFSPKSLQINS